MGRVQCFYEPGVDRRPEAATLESWERVAGLLRLRPALRFFRRDEGPFGEVIHSQLVHIYLRSKRFVPEIFLWWIGLHELRHCWQSEHGLPLDEDTEALIRLLPPVDNATAVYHDFLPEEVDANMFADVATRWRGSLFRRRLLDYFRKIGPKPIPGRYRWKP